MPVWEAVRFYLGYLTEYDGYLVTCPSTSPENCFLDRKGEKHSVTFASTMDISILKELFATYLQICKILKVDVLEKETEFALKKLPPFKIVKPQRKSGNRMVYGLESKSLGQT